MAEEGVRKKMERIKSQRRKRYSEEGGRGGYRMGYEKRKNKLSRKVIQRGSMHGPVAFVYEGGSGTARAQFLSERERERGETSSFIFPGRIASGAFPIPEACCCYRWPARKFSRRKIKRQKRERERVREG